MHNVEHVRKEMTAKLLELGEPLDVAERLLDKWATAEDFLLTDHEQGQADFVVGNPPYIRLEGVPVEVSNAYRAECSTMRGRADIFVGFFEKGLSLLAPGGRLAFICADRWMRNQYGEKLRSLVAGDYSVDSVVAMREVDAFEDEVSAYPAVTVLRRGPQGNAKVVEARSTFDQSASERLVGWLSGDERAVPAGDSFEAVELKGWFNGGGHWPEGSPRTLKLLADLEGRFRPLEDPRTGTRVGIGVASGCDEVFVVREAAGVEKSRLLPTVTAADIAEGDPRWGGRYLVNPWEDGRLVDLADFPGLRDYLESHGPRVRSRHVARRRPGTWYRTIDRVDPTLLGQPKLLLPDLKAFAHPVLEPGRAVPAPQPLLRGVGHLGLGGTGRAAALRRGQSVRGLLLREDARWHIPVPGPVPPKDPGPRPGLARAPTSRPR